MNEPAFHGVFPILATPFDAEEQLDLPSLQRLVAFMADLGVDGITILGVLGEADRLGDSERLQVIRTSVAAASGRIPVVVGASHRGTRAAGDLCRMARDEGAAAVMLTPQAEPGLNDERIIELFARIAADCRMPIVVQDHPASTGVQMPVSLLLRLAREIHQVACFKAEAVPTAAKIRALKAQLARPVPILTGLGALYALFDLEAGSDGFMTGFAFPELLQALVVAAKNGERIRLRTLYQRLLPLIVFEQQPGVAVRKELLRRRGLFASATVRHPGTPLPAGAAAQLDDLLAWLLPETDLTRPLTF